MKQKVAERREREAHCEEEKESGGEWEKRTEGRRYGEQKVEEMEKGISTWTRWSAGGSLARHRHRGEVQRERAPVVGHVKNGYDLSWGGPRPARRARAVCHGRRRLRDREYRRARGGVRRPEAWPFADETKNEVAGASIATTSFALKTGLVFGDGRRAAEDWSSAPPTRWRASHSSSIGWRRNGARIAINNALSAGNLDVRLCRTYALMSCYLLTSERAEI